MLFTSRDANYIYSVISSDLSEAMKIPPDLSFICADGTMVHTHRTLLATFSPFLRSLLASLEPVRSSCSQVLSMPDVLSSALEEVVHMISKPWRQQTRQLKPQHISLLSALGIPAWVSDNREDALTLTTSQSLPPYSDNDEESPLSGSSACQTSNIDSVEYKEPKCTYCETKFRDRTQESVEDICIHLGEVHFEAELFMEQQRRFPNGSSKCDDCGCEIDSSYVQKEHIVLSHPWPLLKATAEEIVGTVVGQEMPVEESSKERPGEEPSNFVMKPVDEELPVDISNSLERLLEPSPNKEDSNSKAFESSLQLNRQMDDFIKRLNSSSKTEHYKSYDQSTPSKEKVVENTALNSPGSRTTVGCPKCITKWTYHSGTRKSDLKSRIKTHLIDQHFEKELLNSIENSFVGDVCRTCEKTIKSSSLQKKHVRNVHKALEIDVMVILDAMLGKNVNKKDPVRLKRKNSPKTQTRNEKKAKRKGGSEENMDTSGAYQQNANSSDFCKDSQDNVSNYADIYECKDLNYDESKACQEIQQAIEFSDSEDED